MMTLDEMIAELGELFDNWMDGSRPESEEIVTMDNILATLRKMRDAKN